MRSLAVVTFFVVGQATATGSGGQPATFPPCPAPFDQLLADNVFGAYPAPLQAETSAAPDVKRGMARLYRTVIREEAKQGPNFAGHYTLISIGCGAGTACVAIEDDRTGKIYFPPALSEATALIMDTGKYDVPALNYRKNSRLLIVVGTPNEELRREGASYFAWGSGKLTLLRFTPTAKLCGS